MQHREPNRHQIVRNVALFRTLDEEQLRQVAALLKEQRYHKGEIIFHQGDPGGCLYLISSGQVRIYVANPDGREATIRIYGHDTAFGEFSVLDGESRSASAAAIDDVVALILYREDFMELLRHNFDLVQRVIAMLTERVRYTTTYSEQLAFLSVPGRVAALLVQLASVEPDERVPVRLKLTQQELASFVSTTREWVNRALRDFAAQDLIRNERGAVVVLNREGLRQQID
jgi:CRP/FNR family cyclic AMP-dependent transcriptional regulator